MLEAWVPLLCPVCMHVRHGLGSRCIKPAAQPSDRRPSACIALASLASLATAASRAQLPSQQTEESLTQARSAKMSKLSDNALEGLGTGGPSDAGVAGAVGGSCRRFLSSLRSVFIFAPPRLLVCTCPVLGLSGSLFHSTWSPVHVVVVEQICPAHQSPGLLAGYLAG